MTRRAALALLAALAAGTALASGWESPAFATATARPSKIAILPAESSMVRTRLNEAMPFVKETMILEDALRREAGARLQALGYQPDLASLSREAIAADPALQAIVHDVESSVAEVVDVAAGKPKDIGRGRFSVGEAALPLAARTGAEGFLWLESRSVVPSKGQRTLASIFSVLSGSYGVPVNQTQVLAVLIDARTGDLASVTTAVTGGPVLKEPAQVAANAVRDVFQQWPAFTVARRIAEKKLAASASQAKPQVAMATQAIDEDALIARFEDADARLDGRPVAGPPETVDARTEFTQEGHAGAANGAPQATLASLFEPAPADPDAAPATAPAATVDPPAPATRAAPEPVAAPAPAPSTPMPSTPAAPALPAAPRARPAEPAPAPAPATSMIPVTPAPPSTPARSGARSLWDAPRAAQPAPSRQIVLQMVEGSPALTVRNSTPAPLLVSADLGEWRNVAPGEETRFETGAGSHRIIAADASGAEVARATVLIGSRLASAEIRPF